MVIYVATNKVNGKQYVGQTRRELERRWAEHLDESSGCTALRNAIRKYGREAFSLEVVEACDTPEDLNEAEQRWIRQLNTLSPHGYNLTTGGDGGKELSAETKARMSNSLRQSERLKEHHKRLSLTMKGRTLSESVKQKIAEKLRGQVLSEETRRKMGDARRGRKRPPEFGKKVSEGKMGYKHSEEAKRRMSESHKGVPLAESQREKIGESLRAYYSNPVARLKHSKLTMEEAEEMRRLHAEGATYRMLCEQFGVGMATVSRIINGQRYKAS